MFGVARVRATGPGLGYKLLRWDKDRLIRPGMTGEISVQPQGWSQVAAELVGDEGRVIAADILPMDSIAG